mmetsp:Transcript_70863/g.117733  ORF Transcript_70863/g.117733 Transcript_70863/m.117733 type:complete len:280 (-) Transcript_70863:23-862(-)
MSAFAALAEFDGDTDVVEQQREKQREVKALQQREQAQAKIRFEELKNRGVSNWADSDDDDDAFFESAPRMNDGHAGGAQWEEDGAEEEQQDENETHELAVALVPAPESSPTNGSEEAQPNKKGRNKDAHKKQEDLELDSLLAELDTTTEKENPEGMSKAAAKRAKKKAKEAAGNAGDGAAPASTQDADAKAEKPGKNPPESEDNGKTEDAELSEDVETAGKSAEEVKALMKARTEAAKKKKASKANASSAAAAAAAECKARGGKPSKKKDKSHYNQQPA